MPTNPRRAVVGLVRLGVGCLCLGGLLLVVHAWTWEYVPSIHVQWRAGLSTAERAVLENTFQLVVDEKTGQNRWAYDLLDISSSNIKALVEHPDVVDTMDIDRNAYRPRGSASVGDHTAWLIHRLPIARYPLIGSYLFEILFGGALVCLSGAFYLNRRATRLRRDQAP